MYVRNVVGFNFSFKYREASIYIPFDGNIYSIPDDCRIFRELKVILPMHVRTQKVIYINKNGQVASRHISGHKRRGRPLKGEEKRKRAIRLSKGLAINKDLAKKVMVSTNEVMDLDLDAELVTNVVVESTKDVDVNVADTHVNESVNTDIVTEELPVKKKQGRPRKIKDKNTTSKKQAKPRKAKTKAKKVTPKKQGRPKKKTN